MIDPAGVRHRPSEEDDPATAYNVTNLNNQVVPRFVPTFSSEFRRLMQERSAQREDNPSTSALLSNNGSATGSYVKSSSTSAEGKKSLVVVLELPNNANRKQVTPGMVQSPSLGSPQMLPSRNFYYGSHDGSQVVPAHAGMGVTFALNPNTPVLVISREVPAKEFVLFGKLPLEIRLMVWRLAEADAKGQDVVVEACPSSSVRDHRIFKAVTPTPTLLRTCGESRREIIKSYKLCFIEPRTNQRSIYINFAKDTLFVILLTEKEASADWKELTGQWPPPSDNNGPSGRMLTASDMADGEQLQLTRCMFVHNKRPPVREYTSSFVNTPTLVKRAFIIQKTNGALSALTLGQKKAYLSRVCKATDNLGGLPNITHYLSFAPLEIRHWDAAWLDYRQLATVLAPYREEIRGREITRRKLRHEAERAREKEKADRLKAIIKAERQQERDRLAREREQNAEAIAQQRRDRINFRRREQRRQAKLDSMIYE